MLDLQVFLLTLIAFITGYVLAWVIAQASLTRKLDEMSVRLIRAEADKRAAQADYQARFDLISRSLATFAVSQHRIAQSVDELLSKPAREKLLKCQIIESV